MPSSLVIGISVSATVVTIILLVVLVVVSKKKTAAAAAPAAKVILFDELSGGICLRGGSVSCGGYGAPNCGACPDNNGTNMGKAWCNGDCSWDDSSNSCKKKASPADPAAAK